MIKFSVQTLDQDALKTAAQDLFALAVKDGTPDICIGIRTGGYIVAQCLQDTLPENTTFLPLTCRRPGTAKKSKSSMIKTVLKTLPYFISNRLRIAEHIYLTQRKEPRPRTDFIPDKKEITDLKAALADKPDDVRILLIDDSVDSGATMLALMDIVQNLAGEKAIVKSSAITLTTENPLVQPDYKLYQNVLCRFPWSFDFKG